MLSSRCTEGSVHLQLILDEPIDEVRSWKVLNLLHFTEVILSSTYSMLSSFSDDFGHVHLGYIRDTMANDIFARLYLKSYGDISACV